MSGNYRLGYDTMGRKIVINSEGKYVTHIPCDLSAKEVIAALQNGEKISFDARNQGMQNNPACQVDESVPVEVAPIEKWPLFYAWEMCWFNNWDDHDMRTFEEFEREFSSSGLTSEQEFQVIREWQDYLKNNPHTKKSFEQFREESIKQISPATSGAKKL